jgi:uncharacterized protein involved in exopolysaccharide biosynthesis
MSISATIRFKRYLTVILRWLLIILVVFALTLLSGAYITNHVLPKVYTATAQMQVHGQPHAGSFDETSLQAKIETMESPEILLPVINDLGLDQAWARRVFKSKEDQLAPTEALEYMHHVLRIDVIRGTDIVAITASSDVPKEAADIANAIADRYKTLRDVQEDERENRGEDSLRNQIVQQQKVVDEKKAAVGKMPQDQSPAYQAAQRELDQQQATLDALSVGLNRTRVDNQLQESPVRIFSRAEPPEYPSRPRKALDLIITIVVAGFLSIMAASFVEMILLFSRAATRTDN